MQPPYFFCMRMMYAIFARISKPAWSGVPCAIHAPLRTMIDQSDTVTQPLPMPATSSLRLNLATDKRLYCVELSQDLLGDWMVTRSWKDKTDGRVGRKQTMVESHTIGLALLDTVVRKQAKLGYTPC
jgi:hypothetical protein